jgi:hypothetical protein
MLDCKRKIAERDSGAVQFVNIFTLEDSCNLFGTFTDAAKFCVTSFQVHLASRFAVGLGSLHLPQLNPALFWRLASVASLISARFDAPTPNLAAFGAVLFLYSETCSIFFSKFGRLVQPSKLSFFKTNAFVFV